MVGLLKSKDNRLNPRLDFHSCVRYQLRGKPEFDRGVSKDISCGGLLLTNEKYLSPASLVMLEIDVLSRVLRPVGKIAWSMPLAHSPRSQTGIEFVEFNQAERNYLKDFIAMQLGQFKL